VLDHINHSADFCRFSNNVAYSGNQIAASGNSDQYRISDTARRNAILSTYLLLAITIHFKNAIHEYFYRIDQFPLARCYGKITVQFQRQYPQMIVEYPKFSIRHSIFYAPFIFRMFIIIAGDSVSFSYSVIPKSIRIDDLPSYIGSLLIMLALQKTSGID
jgi:hypothetical protein